VRRFFTLYFIPCIPLNLLGEYVECQSCEATYQPEVLEYDPGAAEAQIEAEVHGGIRRIMVDMMMADGVADPEEIKTIRAIYEDLSGKPISEVAVLSEVDKAGARTAVETAAALVGVLNDSGKELVVRAAFQVAASDGVFQAEEKALLESLAKALEMTSAHYKGVLLELTDTA
jgi:tellurite resistance protein